ncbi:hypothetical protein [Arthrobacter sp. USHLN218]|uniref:hypothetical protein n=1 Tax=Arthrobacter sp. USHLN218 TaxID=3081232 RepID=UPI003016DCC0
MPDPKKPGYHLNLKGPAYRALLAIMRATGLTPREAIKNAIYRYEADLIDGGQIKPKPKQIEDVDHA